MALTYQALNGTVISKTTTIQGPDISKAGAPMLALSLANNLNFFSFVSNSASDYTYETTTSAIKESASYSRNFENYNAIAFNTSGILGFAYKNPSTTMQISLKGKAIWVLLSPDNELITVERDVNTTVSQGFYILFKKPADGNYVISFTFTPIK